MGRNILDFVAVVAVLGARKLENLALAILGTEHLLKKKAAAHLASDLGWGGPLGRESHFEIVEVDDLVIRLLAEQNALNFGALLLKRGCCLGGLLDTRLAAFYELVNALSPLPKPLMVTDRFLGLGEA